jgi:alcohol dehydrogenase class IV
VAWVRDLVSRLQIPTLARHGITAADLPEIARRSLTASSMKANPVPLTEPELIAVLREAL